LLHTSDFYLYRTNSNSWPWMKMATIFQRTGKTFTLDMLTFYQHSLIMLDRYMRISGFAAEALRGEREISETLPRKELRDYWSCRPEYEEVSAPPIRQ